MGEADVCTATHKAARERENLLGANLCLLLPGTMETVSVL